MQYSVRQATIKDLDTLDRIYTENMQRYVEKVYPWNPNLFCDRFTPQDYQIIEIENRIIGFIKVVISSTDLYLGEIQIDRNYQRRGIGTDIVKLIIQKARSDRKRLYLKVIQGNPAERLYQRLGFTIFEESRTHKKMQIIV